MLKYQLKLFSCSIFSCVGQAKSMLTFTANLCDQLGKPLFYHELTGGFLKNNNLSIVFMCCYVILKIFIKNFFGGVQDHFYLQSLQQLVNNAS